MGSDWLPAMIARLSLSWRVGFHAMADATPSEWVPASVPGAVQLDWARAKGWPPYWHAEEFRRYAWMEDVFWTYEATLDFPPSERIWFVCGGIDYRWDLFLGDRLIESREGMFSPVDADLAAAGARPGDSLRVRIHPIPKRHRNGEDRWQADRTCKPPCSYGWDWHPRLVPSGIWEDAFLLAGEGRIRDAGVTYELDTDARTASVTFHCNADGAPDLIRRVRMLAPDGSLVFEGKFAPGETAMRMTLSGLELWWPHDHGAQPLYATTFELVSDDGTVDAAVRRTGFRRVRLVMNDEEWTRPENFPKSRTHPPITLEINGRKVFAKGTNWIAPEIFPGTITRETYAPLLELARSTHFNLLRVWGGAIVNKEPFYDLCDELGLMVWTEFPLACLPYEDDRGYLRVLERESEAIVRRVARHASHVLWCGGNELFNSWSGMTDQSKALRLLNAQCYRLDPDSPFLPTSPVGGMGHGHYVFRDKDGREVFEIFASAGNTAYTEFGCPGPASAGVIREIVPEAELWPPAPGGSWEAHHGFNAWVYCHDSWLCLGILRHYFGEIASLDELVERGQWLQCEGKKFIFEEARRQKPRCAMALNWCFNEPWPTAANNSLISWPVRPKPALAAVRSACRPVCLSARIRKFSWHNDEVFDAEIWLLNDAPEAVPPAEILYAIRIGGTRLPIGTWAFPGASASENLRGPNAVLKLPRVAGASEMVLEVTSPDHADWNQIYRLQYRPDHEEPLYGPAARRALNR